MLISKPVREFSIKVERLNSGKVIYTPIVRNTYTIFNYPIRGDWERITAVEGRYMLINIDFNPNLTPEECQSRIDGYKKQLEREKQHQVKEVEFKQIAD